MIQLKHPDFVQEKASESDNLNTQKSFRGNPLNETGLHLCVIMHPISFDHKHAQHYHLIL